MLTSKAIKGKALTNIELINIVLTNKGKDEQEKTWKRF